MVVKNIIKYLRRTKDMFLVYGGEEELVAKCFIDARFDTDPDDSKSQSEYVFVMNGVAVSLRSSKQSVVAGSSTEAEYVAASEAAHEAVWMKEIIFELGERRLSAHRQDVGKTRDPPRPRSLLRHGDTG
jgi:hypothetical protein